MIGNNSYCIFTFFHREEQCWPEAFFNSKSLELEMFKAAAAHNKSSSSNEKQDFEICMRGIVQYRLGRRRVTVS